MSNLLKSFSLICNEDKRIIDSNEAITEKLEQIRREVIDGGKSDFSLGLNPENVERLLADDEQSASGENLDNAQLQVMTDQMVAEAKAKAKTIVDRAQSDALKIVDKAIAEAEGVKKKAYEEGYRNGEAAGRETAEAELRRLDEEYREKTETMEAEYHERMEKMEPELIDVMLEVFADVTRVISEDERGMIMALVDKVLTKTEASSSYIIKTGREDAAFLRENKDKILESVDRDINLEIVEDVSMKKNECLIDTDFGIYDCGLDMQLNNLIRSIKILSCTAEK